LFVLSLYIACDTNYLTNVSNLENNQCSSWMKKYKTNPTSLQWPWIDFQSDHLLRDSIITLCTPWCFLLGWRTDHDNENSVPYSLRIVCGFFNVPQSWNSNTFSSVILKTSSGGLAMISKPRLTRENPVLSHRYDLTLTHSLTQTDITPITYCSALRASL